MNHSFEKLKIIQMNSVTVYTIGKKMISHRVRDAKHGVVKYFEELGRMPLFGPIMENLKMVKSL